MNVMSFNSISMNSVNLHSIANNFFASPWTPNSLLFRCRTVRRGMRMRRCRIGALCLAAEKRPLIQDGILRINGRAVLTGVPENVILTMVSDDGSMYLGAALEGKRSRHVFNLGVLRFKIWWVIPRMGTSGSDIPVETQMLLLEAREGVENDKDSFYILFLPVLDGAFRSSLQGSSLDELQCCIESGDPAVEESQFLEAIYVNCGTNPFDLIKQSMKTLEKHKGTFSIRESKKKPAILDWFGWCTWDAFYFDVNPRGIEEGLKSFYEGGITPRFLLIDDGWQDITNEFQNEGEKSIEGSQYGARLVSIRENSKFRDISNEASDDKIMSMKDFISNIKSTFGVKYVYVWHALMGYWGGVHPNATETKKYNSKLIYPIQSPGNLTHSRDLTMDCMEKYGVAMVDPEKAFDFYDDYHSYLRAQNVDGVKVDVQNILETLGGGLGGRVSLTRRFQQALEKSVSKNFEDNSIICCMGQSNDSVYHSKVSAITRVSDDYMPRNLSSQTLHVAAVAFNSIFFGEVVVPDWDMFYSLHYAAEFHATARALGGCGIYVSDKPNQHDFELLKQLVLPDGSILRAKYPGRPTRDCLFNDPIIDGKSLLKIWNLNEYTGILGVFNCQGAGIWPCLDKDVSRSDSQTAELAGHISPSDVEYLDEVAGYDWAGDCAVYSYKTGSLSRLSKNGSLTVTLKVLESELYTISPVKIYNKKIQFAPIGLINMYNSGGAVQGIKFNADKVISIKGRGSGLFGAYSGIKPTTCTLNSTDEEFNFDESNSLLTLIVPLGIDSWDLDIKF